MTVARPEATDLAILPPGAAHQPPGGAALHSRLVQRLRRRYGDLLPLLAPGCPTAASMAACLRTLRERGHPVGAALRILRSLVMERLVVLDCEQGRPLATVMHTMTELAELALDEACREAFRQLDARWGAPLTERGQRAQFWVIGMGKLGGRELNVSSDIDLVYIYDDDGQTAGSATGERISVREYFTHAARRIQGLIAETTEHGLVFRIDLALRPNGNAGTVVSSLESLREYLLVQGREWERFAWLKSRVVAPAGAIADSSAQALRGVVLPFVFRKYLDYNVFESLRMLHAQIRSHAARRSAGRPARLGDIKLSCGGIREIEFSVQLPQLVRGGQFPELRTRSTLVALQRLAEAELITAEIAEQLRQAYIFLRRVEHRIQYLDDQQTHILPADDADLLWLARTLGFDSASAFLARLDQHREAVAEQFNQLLGENKPCRTCHPPSTEPGDASLPPPGDLQELGPRVSSASVREQLQAWQPRLQELGPRTRQRLTQVMTQTVAWLNRGRVSETAALRFIDWIDSLLGRDNYLALLQERPVVHERVLHVLNTARWPARYLLQHPAVIDELASPDILAGRFNGGAFEHELQERRSALVRTQEDTEENLLNLLRRAQHAEVFRTLLRDLDRRITVEQVADDLSALADAILRVAVQWCWPFFRRRHREQPRLGIIGYGKLGGKELGYGSDLDLVFVFEDDDEQAPQAYAGFVRKLISWLTVKTAEGGLYEIDTALRPNGNAGLLVTRFDAYADYQQRRGSNTAWTWEHQAMTRARMVPPRSPASPGALPPEGAAATLGRPGGDGGAPPRSSAASGSFSSEGAADILGQPGGDGEVPLQASAAPGALTPEAAAVVQEGSGSGDGGVAGAPTDLVARFEAVRNAVITAPRDLAALRREIIDMRRRIHQAHPVRAGLFDVKHSAGGMVDVEFVTQYLVLAHSGAHPALRPNLGNISLLVRAEQAGLLAPGVGRAAANAYRTLRHVQHRARLDERPTQVAPGTLLRERAAIQQLWQQALGTGDAP